MPPHFARMFVLFFCSELKTKKNISFANTDTTTGQIRIPGKAQKFTRTRQHRTPSCDRSLAGVFMSAGNVLENNEAVSVLA